jgi:ClpP class serine protease
MKDAGGPWKDLSQEERAYYQGMVDELYHDFLQVVHRSRKDFLSMEEIKKIAGGRVFHAKKALELKLIDAVGYFDDALKKILSLASIRDANVIAYTYHPAKKTNIYANETTRDKPLSLEIKPFENLLPSLKTGIYYIWLPGLEE